METSIRKMAQDAQLVMFHNDWKWALTGELKVPSIDEVESMIHRLIGIANANEKDQSTAACGRLVVTKDTCNAHKAITVALELGGIINDRNA